MEIELKLQLAPHDAQRFTEHALLGQYAPHEPQQLSLHDIYFDTADMRLARAGAGLRVRQSGTGWVQTMKAGGGIDGGLHSRHEWEGAVDGPAPDLAALIDLMRHKSPWRALLKQLGGKGESAPLLPLFTTRIERSVWQLALPQGDTIECVLDQGVIECGDSSGAVCEIELELKSGKVASLFDIALALQQDIPLQIASASKAERGYLLYAPQQLAASKAQPLALTKKMKVGEVFQAIAANCLQQVQANQAGVVEGHVESLHQMRVGLRRLRSALGMFKKLLCLPPALQPELDWLVAALGDARDWDVLAGSVVPALAEELEALQQPDGELADAPDSAMLEQLQQAALAAVGARHALAADAAGSGRYTRLMLELARWLQLRGWRDAASKDALRQLKQPVPGFARQILQHDQRRLLKRGHNLRQASPETRHRARIAAKKSRYATEFFASLYPADKVRSYVGVLSGLQDELGWLNDLAVADRLLQQLPDGQPQLQAPAAFLRGYLAARAGNNLGKMAKAWKKFSAAKAPAWHSNQHAK